jgi:NAD-dependent SIR2 family protein deacetylase
MKTELHRAAQLIGNAECLLITAGAGMSVDSGLPDYRGKDGFWNHFPVYRELGVDYARMTRPSGFTRDPHFAWGFYGYCLNLYRGAQPHSGYQVLRGLAELFGSQCFVLTTNVDGFFLKAGVHQTQVRECHGSIHSLQCIHPCQRSTWSADCFHPEVDIHSMRLRDPLPLCPHCGALARPAIFAFGDTGYVWEATQTQTALYQAWRERVVGKRLVVLECGSGPTVPGLRREGEALARQHQGHLIRINPRDHHTNHPDDIGLPYLAAEALKTIYQTLQFDSSS